jgi:hypothetical protein
LNLQKIPYVRGVLSLSVIALLLGALSVMPISIKPVSAQAGGFDFGDAPDGGPTGYPGPFAQTGSFPSLLSSDGARVQSIADVTLGPTATTEANALVTNVDSDDGVTGLVILTVSIPPPARLSVTVNPQPGGSGGTFHINVLIDLNLDGKWGGSTPSGQPEWVVRNYPVNIAAGSTTPVTVDLPEFAFANGNALPNGAWMRIALTKESISSSDWTGTGQFSSGEIEDHVITLPIINGKTPAIPILLECAPNPVLFPPGGQLALFNCTVASGTPGFATINFACNGGINIMAFPGPDPFPVGPAGPVNVGFLATKAPNPPPRVTCTVTATSVDPASFVTSGGVTVGYADSTVEQVFDTSDEDQLASTYVALSETSILVGETPSASAFVNATASIKNSVANTRDTPVNATHIVQVTDADGYTQLISLQNVTLFPGEPVDLSVDWSPSAAGQHVIKTFLWEASSAPLALSTGMAQEVGVGEEAVEEGPDGVSPESDSVIRFTHMVGQSSCEQHVGGVFLFAEGGEWVVEDQPEWLDIIFQDDRADLFFNCNIEVPEAQTLEGNIAFRLFSESEGTRSVNVQVSGEILPAE